MNRFELWDKVTRCRWQQHFRLLVALWYKHPVHCKHLFIKVVLNDRNPGISFKSLSSQNQGLWLYANILLKRIGHNVCPVLGNRSFDWMAFIDSNELMPSQQSAYRQHHSTETAVLKLESLQRSPRGSRQRTCICHVPARPDCCI